MRFILACMCLLALSGCVLAPRGTKEEQKRIDDAGKVYERPALPPVPEPAEWRSVLQRAFLANGDLEAAYYQWRAAMARLPQMAEFPNTNFAPSFSYMFSGGMMKSWDRTTVNLGFDPGEMLMFPTKVAQAGKIALDETKMAGAKFRAAKFELQRKVLTEYLDLALMDQRLAITGDNVRLLEMLAQLAGDRVRAGGNQQDLLRAQTQWRLAENELHAMQAERDAMAAMLNGMLARDARAPLVLPRQLPATRPIAADDARLIAVAVEQNPELESLAHEVQGRKDALELARMAWIPDINPMAAFTGSVSQMLGAMVSIPTTVHEIQGRIDESKALLKATEAMQRQGRSERAASFVAALYAMRSAERQTQMFQQVILPRAEQLLASARQSYSTGTGTFIELIDAQRTILDVRLMVAQMRVEREKRLAELEALAGTDIETLAQPTTTTTQRIP